MLCDLNTIKMINLDSPADLRTLYYGAADANFVALALDAQNNTLYFSDLTR